jgi:hypothetical protein
MTHSLISIGVALIDAGTEPEIVRWIIALLSSLPRTYLPRPEVEADQRRTIVRFHVADRALLFAFIQPGSGWWCRIRADGSQDRGELGKAPGRDLQGLFDWLLDGTLIRA